MIIGKVEKVCPSRPAREFYSIHWPRGASGFYSLSTEGSREFRIGGNEVVLV